MKKYGQKSRHRPTLVQRPSMALAARCAAIACIAHQYSLRIIQDSLMALTCLTTVLRVTR